MSDAELQLIGTVMGVAAPFLALFLTLWWEDRRKRRRRR